MIGPPIGSVMFGLWGYAWAFYVFSVVIGIIIICQLIYIPNILNFDKVNQESDLIP